MIPLRLRQLLALLILLALLAAVIGLVLGPLVERFLSDEESIDSLSQRLEVYQRLAHELPAQEARLAGLQRSDPMSRLVVAESRPALAGAGLQQLIGHLIGGVGAQVVSTQIVSRAEAESPLPAVGLKVHMRGENEQLVRLLYDLAYHEPLLLVENLVVLSNPRVDMQRLRRPEDLQAVPSLDISFDVKAFIAKEAKP